MEKRINKHVYTWVGTFLFGWLGVDRFMRGQILFGILKLLSCFVPSLILRIFLHVGVVGILLLIQYVWIWIDFIIALTKLGKYEKEFVFEKGKWSESFTKEGLKKKVEEKAERELREKSRLENEQREKERKEQYKKDILSGAISFDKEVQQIENALLEYGIYQVATASKMVSIGNELSAGSSYAINKVKNFSIKYPPFVSDKLSALSEIKSDSRVNKLQLENSRLMREYQELDSTLRNAQMGLSLRGL